MSRHPFAGLPPVQRDRLLRTMSELRRRNLSCPAIATVLELYEGVDGVSEASVRRALYSAGLAQPNPRKRRPGLFGRELTGGARDVGASGRRTHKEGAASS